MRHLVGGNAVLGNVTGLTAVVTSLGKLVGSQSALLGDVAVLATRVTLDGVSLAILGEVVWTTALVAHWALGTTELLSSESWGGRSLGVLWALSGDVAKLRAVVALGALGAVWAVTLDVSHIATRVALL